VGLGFNWINLGYDKDKWLAVANTVMNLRLLYNAGNFLIAEKVLASQEAFCFMELVLYKCDMLSLRKQKECGFIKEFDTVCSGYYSGPKRVMIKEV